QSFRAANGALYDCCKESGRDWSDCGGTTPLAEFLRIRDVSPTLDTTTSWIVAHLNELTESDLNLLTEIRQKFSIVHCPRSHSYFGHSGFQFERLQRLGFNVCLGTDSLASNDDLSLFAEMRAFQKKFPDVSPEEILKMVTVNGARGLQQENALGKIRPDFQADLIAIPIARHGESVLRQTRSTSVFEEIVAFDRPVNWSMIGGRVQNSA